MNRGKYLVKVRSFHESMLLPFPKKPVQVVLAKRDKWMHFQDIFSTVIDANSRFVNREKRGRSFYEKWAQLRAQQLAAMKATDFYGKVGAFEGSGYSANGLYRPAIDCRMFSLSLVPYDPVCSAAIEQMIDFYAE